MEPKSNPLNVSNASLTAEEKSTYEWQMWVPGVGETGQEKLKSASVLISRCGGLGSPVAYELAAAGIGKLVIAHAGNVKPSDLNRQLLMTHDWLGKPRVESAKRRLQELNPRLEVVTVPENINDINADKIVRQVDIVVDAAPMFEERFAMNNAAFAQGKPIVECAMYDCECSITTMIPGQTVCLRCLVPSVPPAWKREFPVFGAVSGTVGCIAAMEVIKLITGIGAPLANRMLTIDLLNNKYETIQLRRRAECRNCKPS